MVFPISVDPTDLVRSGLIRDLSSEAYHAGPGVSKSQLDKLAKSPAHFKAALESPSLQTPAMRIGSLFHSIVLEPEKLRLVVAPKVDKRTKEGKATWAEFEAQADGAEIVDVTEYDMLMGMAESVRNHPAARALLEGCEGVAEGSCYWYDNSSGELCRCRPDWLRADGIVVDLKSTDDASPRGFRRSIEKYRYYVQDAFYSDGISASLDKRTQGFVFVAVEKVKPFAVGVYSLDSEDKAVGRDVYQKNLLTLAECKINKSWPAYSDRIESISLSAWKVKQENEDVTEY